MEAAAEGKCSAAASVLSALLFKKNVNCAMIFYKISDFWCCITGVML